MKLSANRIKNILEMFPESVQDAAIARAGVNTLDQAATVISDELITQHEAQETKIETGQVVLNYADDMVI